MFIALVLVAVAATIAFAVACGLFAAVMWAFRLLIVLIVGLVKSVRWGVRAARRDQPLPQS